MCTQVLYSIVLRCKILMIYNRYDLGYTFGEFKFEGPNSRKLFRFFFFCVEWWCWYFFCKIFRLWSIFLHSILYVVEIGVGITHFWFTSKVCVISSKLRDIIMLQKKSNKQEPEKLYFKQCPHEEPYHTNYSPIVIFYSLRSL